MRTLDEFRQSHPTPVRNKTPDLQVVAQQAVRMEALTGDSDWDHFLAYLEAALQAAEAQLKSEDVKLRNPFLVNDEAIRILKAHITRIEVRIDTLKEVLMLPKFLKEHGELARAQIADLAKGA